MGDVVTVTDAAAARTAALLARTGAAGLRVTVQSAGCEGFVALLDLAHEPGPGEVEVGDNGVRLFADVPSMLRLPGATLDHRPTPHGAEFVWSHPSSEQGCSCAEKDL
ncbi:MAG TPA: iron-sulfur cluster assembly accessory protein [Frankiaceae bacterium]|nr:iron-sulfur cluster assembly accessory protein [Frankiaceae bacterium]